MPVDVPESAQATTPTALPFVNEIVLMPVDVPESVQAPTPTVPPARNSSTIPEVLPVKARLNLSTDDGYLFDHGRALVSSVRMRDANLPFSDYVEYAGPPGVDPRSVGADTVSDSIIRIIEVEGPVVAKRVYDIYLRGCGIRRMGRELKSIMNKALAHAIRQGRIVSVDETEKGGLLFSVVRVKGSPPIRLRTRGPRTFDEIPPSELNAVARYLAESPWSLIWERRAYACDLGLVRSQAADYTGRYVVAGYP